MDKKKIFMLIEDLFEDSEVVYPYYRMQEEGYEVQTVGPEAGREYKGKKGITIVSDIAASKADIDETVAIIIPGGYAPDRMRRHKLMVDLVIKAHKKCKVVAAICHGPWMLVEADIIRGKNVTGFFSISTDLKNAGGKYIDREVVVDENIITSRYPQDLPVFCKNIIEIIEAYSHK
jgi:protease I